MVTTSTPGSYVRSNVNLTGLPTHVTCLLKRVHAQVTSAAGASTVSHEPVNRSPGAVVRAIVIDSKPRLPVNRAAIHLE